MEFPRASFLEEAIIQPLGKPFPGIPHLGMGSRKAARPLDKACGTHRGIIKLSLEVAARQSSFSNTIRRKYEQGKRSSPCRKRAQGVLYPRNLVHAGLGHPHRHP